MSYISNYKDLILVLSLNEIEFLNKYGEWLEGLVQGTIIPKTEQQIRFKNVALGLIQAETENEILWIKFRRSVSKLQSIRDESNALKGKIELTAFRFRELQAENETLKQDVPSLKEMIEILQSKLEKYEPSKPPDILNTHPTGSTCRRCGGSGGGGNCSHCGGNGLEP